MLVNMQNSLEVRLFSVSITIQDLSHHIKSTAFKVKMRFYAIWSKEVQLIS